MRQGIETKLFVSSCKHLAEKELFKPSHLGVARDELTPAGTLVTKSTSIFFLCDLLARKLVI